MSTENALSIRTAACGRYFAVGMDYPAVRVFDTSTSTLACTVELTLKNTPSLLAVSLVSLTLGDVALSNGAASRAKKGTATEEKNGTSLQEVEVDHVSTLTFAAVGLSNGTVLLHNVSRDEFVSHISVSETQQPVISLSFCDKYLFCLLGNRKVVVVDVLSGQRIGSATGVGAGFGAVEVQHGASALCAVRVTSSNAAQAKLRTIAAFKDAIDSLPQSQLTQESPMSNSFVVFVAGPTNALYNVEIKDGQNASSTSNSKSSHGRNATRVVLEKLVSFASQSTQSTLAWLSSDATLAMTCSAQEGVVRFWDVSVNSSSVSRCKRTLLCGQRVAHVSVSECESVAAGSDALVAVSTFTGQVMLWNFEGALNPKLAEPAPVPPTVVVSSSEKLGFILFGSLLNGPGSAPSHGGHADSNKHVSRSSLLLLRGTYAMPRFEARDCSSLLVATEKGTKQERSSAVTDSSAVVERTTDEKGTAHVRISLPKNLANELRMLKLERKLTWGRASKTRRGLAAFDGDDEVWSMFYAGNTTWAAHQGVASRAVVTVPEYFDASRVPRAATVNVLPQSRMTLEQQLAATTATGKETPAGQAGAPNARSQSHQHVLGLATTPLYQALHANDVSAVMDLLSIASRTEEEMRITVLALSYSYCMQLLKLLTEKVRGARTQSHLFSWIDCIVRCRGPEMMAIEHAQQLHEKQQPTETESQGTASNQMSGVLSKPSVFVAPLLHQYKTMVSQYDKIAYLYGRTRTFDKVPQPSAVAAVGPRKKATTKTGSIRTSEFRDGPAVSNYEVIQDASSVVSHGGIVFPVMFIESQAKGVGSSIVRLKGHEMKLKREKLRRARKLAAPHRMRREAKKELQALDAEDGDGDSAEKDSMDENGGDGLDLDNLDDMVLDSDGGDDDDGVDDDSDSDTDSSLPSDMDVDLDEEDYDDDEEDEDEPELKRHRRQEPKRGKKADVIADDGDTDLVGDAENMSGGEEFLKQSDSELDTSGEDDEEGTDSDDDEEDDDAASAPSYDGDGALSDREDGDEEDDASDEGDDVRDLLREHRSAGRSGRLRRGATNLVAKKDSDAEESDEDARTHKRFKTDH